MASSDAPAGKARELQTGDLVGNYVIVGKLGQGRHGRGLSREAPRAKSRGGDQAADRRARAQPEMIARFLNEAKIAESGAARGRSAGL